MFQVISQITNREKPSVKIITPDGDFIEIPAVRENGANILAQDIADSINLFSTEDVTVTYD